MIVDAAAAAKTSGVVKVSLVARTDRSGANDYNDKLSQKRGAAVKSELINQGVAADQIAMRAMGESDPLVPTEDGVRHNKNRAVEITLER